MKHTSITQRITNKETESFKQYLKDVSSIKMMTSEEAAICAVKAHSGDQAAIDELVSRNLRFVISVAKQYANANNPLEDLVNEGNIGLILAVERFEPEKGFKFISYAVWWIRKVIIEHISNHGKMIRLPANKVNLLSKLDKRVSELEQKRGYSVCIEELLEEYSSDFTAKDLTLLDGLSNMSIESLDRDLGSGSDGNTTVLLDVIADEASPRADEGIVEENMKTEVAKIISTLKPRDARIMTALFGLDGSTPKTLKEVSEEIGVTREMIRQIKEKILSNFRVKLRNSTLKSY